jgi:16S rRNA G966 N2-methylase RsmD
MLTRRQGVQVNGGKMFDAQSWLNSSTFLTHDPDSKEDWSPTLEPLDQVLQSPPFHSEVVTPLFSARAKTKNILSPEPLSAFSKESSMGFFLVDALPTNTSALRKKE